VVWAVLRLRTLQAKRVRGASDGGPSKAAGGRTLEGENPKGASSMRRAKPPPAARDARKGQSPEVEARRTGSSACPMGDRVGLTTRGFGDRGNAFATLPAGKAPKGRIPGALSGRNKPGQASRGGNRREGNQTLWAERSGSWHDLRLVDPFRRNVL
jgi:hypothetical protein